jgi:single-strand DNA-binding protein
MAVITPEHDKDREKTGMGEMIDLNQCIVSGNCGRDAEMFKFQGGGCKLSFSIAAKKRKKMPDGTWTDVPIWIECVQFFQADKQEGAERVLGKLKKGTKVVLTAKIDYESWDDKNTGKKSSKNFLDVFQTQFEEPYAGPGAGGGDRESSGGRQQSGGNQSRQQPSGGQSRQQTSYGGGNQGSADDEIPF